MRKTVVGLFVLVILSTISAGQLKIGMGNDTFQFGISENRDDQNTYSLHISYEDSFQQNTSYKINIDYTALTLRPFTYSDSNGDFHEISGRTDVIDIYTSIKRETVLNRLKLSAITKLGISLKGNFGGEFNQNLIHRVVDLKEVHLPYEGYRGDLIFGVATGFAYDHFFGDVGIQCSEITTVTSAIGAELGNKAKAKVFLGYDDNFGNSSKLTPSGRTAYYNSGANFGFNIDAGIFSIDYKSYFEKFNGYGIVSINLLAEQTYKKTDLVFSFGRIKWGSKTCDSLILRKDFSDVVSIVFKDDFYTDVYQKSPFKGIDSYASFELGIRLGNILYFQASAGVGKFYKEDHGNTYVENPLKELNFFVSESLEFGCCLPGKLTLGNTKIGMEIFIAEHFISDNGWVEKSYEWRDSNIEKIALEVGFRINFGLDMGM